MATIIPRGDKYLARIRLAKSKPVSKLFKTRTDAKNWAHALEKELRAHAQHAAVRRDTATLTVRGLIAEYLDDVETKKLASFDDKEQQLSHFVNK
ncbi:MAG TPA: hypothetical protein VGM97_01465, partial [Steroidobacteraceae bacterium]